MINYETVITGLAQGKPQHMPLWDADMKTIRTMLNNIYPALAVQAQISGNKLVLLLDEDYLTALLNACCNAFGVTLSAVKGKSRLSEIVYARQAFCYLAWRQAKYPMRIIGNKINRDRSTVLSSIKAAHNYRDTGWKPFLNGFDKIKVAPK